MRTALAILFLCIASHQLLLKLGVLAWYQYNKAYIAENLCENRDKPALKCCGKCYLRKKLAIIDVPADPAARVVLLLSKMEGSPFILPQPISLVAVPAEVTNHRFPYTTPFAEDIHLPVVHPPG